MKSVSAIKRNTCFVFVGQLISFAASLPGMGWVSGVVADDFVAFCNGYLPVLALIGLIAVLPFVFYWVAIRYEHRKERSDIQHSIVKRSFYYQVRAT